MTARAKHTPGPWSVYLGRRVVANITHPGALAGALQDEVADCRNSRNPEGDAALVAAAPDLIAALRGVRDSMAAYFAARESDSALDMPKAYAGLRRAESLVNAAIARAEGGQS